MRTFVQMANLQTTILPERFGSDDVRYPDELARYFIENYSKPGDVVFDPFAGFGTTIRIAEELGREACGLEYDRDRANYIRTTLKQPDRITTGDAREFSGYEFPKIDLILTSPPYMGRHHRENPFTAYSTEGGGYGAYLNDIKTIFAQLKLGTVHGGSAIVEVSNLKHNDAPITTLAWDIGKALSEIWTFEGEVVIGWSPTYGFGYDHSYALVFRND